MEKRVTLETVCPTYAFRVTAFSVDGLLLRAKQHLLSKKLTAGLRHGQFWEIKALDLADVGIDNLENDEPPYEQLVAQVYSTLRSPSPK